ncbi:MAG: virulence RhuM family protein [Bacteroidales bacterium]|nr:virulence RhuM family protein [Bacteroidales bacterium]MDD4216823.1 virulence RhuM family protein [Bacteroidales bacterium]MDY0143252.1 virulence RhuM family protein [Bacteroidales bacterium]
MKTNQLIIYQTEDGKVKIETHFENETVWLNIDQIAELFQKSRSTINEHILNIYKEQELELESSMRKIGNSDFSTKPTNFYNLDVVISVGYRVKSHRGVHFRKWATALIKEYLIKGFTMNDELLKEVGGGNYFDELLARIRDIRSSEKVFWRKVLDLYATSIDYDPKTEEAVLVFKTIQNKMHWATHGETAAETIYKRVDSSKEYVGLTNFKGEIPTKKEVEIAKNYLAEDELNILNRMVTAFLEIAEIQALERTPMYMADWIKQLDAFLKMTNKNILQHLGDVSHQKAIDKAHSEYEIYKEKIKNRITQVEKDFIKQIENKTNDLKK